MSPGEFLKLRDSAIVILICPTFRLERNILFFLQVYYPLGRRQGGGGGGGEERWHQSVLSSPESSPANFTSCEFYFHIYAHVAFRSFQRPRLESFFHCVFQSEGETGTASGTNVMLQWRVRTEAWTLTLEVFTCTLLHTLTHVHWTYPESLLARLSQTKWLSIDQLCSLIHLSVEALSTEGCVMERKMP